MGVRPVFLIVWCGFPQRSAVVMLLILILAGTIEHAELLQRRMAQEQDGSDPEELGMGDSGCLKGLLRALTNSSEAAAAHTLLSTWTSAALASPCNRTSAGPLAGVTCNSMSRVASIKLPSASLVGSLPSYSLSMCSSLTALILSDNALTGLIPTSLGDLPYLATLSLSHNQLSGSIPVELSTCFALSSLDLHHNQLSGSIPGQLGLLPLQHFNVSYNRLSGLIPSTLSNTSTGAPRFGASSFDHNPNLYGYPLLSSTMLPADSASGNGSFKSVVYPVTIAVVVVVVMVLLIFVCWWVARFHQAAQLHRRELAEREQQRRVQSQNCSSRTQHLEDGWKEILTQL